MTETSRVYGFVYSHNGKRYAFDITAMSRDEAEARASSIAAASCVGELLPAEEVTTYSGGIQ